MPKQNKRKTRQTRSRSSASSSSTAVSSTSPNKKSKVTNAPPTEDQLLGDGLPSSLFKGTDLSWTDRQLECAQINNCQKCTNDIKNHKPMRLSNSAVKVFQKMEEMYSTTNWESIQCTGWRWKSTPRPNDNCHNHTFYPPASTERALGTNNPKSLSSGKALDYIVSMEKMKNEINKNNTFTL
tara:strand:- start:11 stop:556 length:546 start_codon:yes stop_codon:yes gene_type:complete